MAVCARANEVSVGENEMREIIPFSTFPLCHVAVLVDVNVAKSIFLQLDPKKKVPMMVIFGLQPPAMLPDDGIVGYVDVSLSLICLKVIHRDERVCAWHHDRICL